MSSIPIGPFASIHLTDVWCIDDDADWLVPGIHQVYRSALDSFFTCAVDAFFPRHGGTVDREVLVSSREGLTVRPMVAVIGLSVEREGGGPPVRFTVRDGELREFRDRVNQILAADAIDSLDDAAKSNSFRVPTLGGWKVFSAGTTIGIGGIDHPNLRVPVKLTKRGVEFYVDRISRAQRAIDMAVEDCEAIICDAVGKKMPITDVAKALRVTSRDRIYRICRNGNVR